MLITQAQVPEKIDFQALARNNEGIPYSNTTIGVQISIRQGSPTGTIEYQETHTAATDDYGLFVLAIGEGDPVLGTFSAIDWTSGSFYTQVEVDPEGGINYTDMGTMELMSVPFALYSERAGYAEDDDADPSNEIQTISESGNVITLSNGGGTVTDNTEDADADPANEIQTISESGNVITLSNGGGTVTDNTEDDDADPANEIQTISESGNVITLSNGGGTVTDNTEDADADPANEFQTISESGNVITLSNGGGTVIDNTEDADADPANEIQTISESGNVITLSNGGGTVIDNTEDADADPNNEIQDLSITGNELAISSGNSVTIPSSAWGQSGNNIYYNNGNVGIGTATPQWTLDINGTINLAADNSYRIAGSPVLTVNGTNTAVGFNVLSSNTTGFSNTAVGKSALFNNTTGSNNTAIGQSTLRNNIGGDLNTAIGRQALVHNTNGIKNTATGSDALRDNISGSYNTANGVFANAHNIHGSYNTAIGTEAGYFNETGSRNVFLGSNAGRNEMDSNKLYVESSDANSANALIYGEFDNDILAFNADVGIGTITPSTSLSNSPTLSSDGVKSTSIDGINWRINDGGYALGIENTATGGSGLLVDAGNNAGTGSIVAHFVSNDTSLMLIQENGNVSIGNSTPVYHKLYVNGSAYSTGSWLGSDKKFKKNIKTIDHPVDLLKKINGASYNWKIDEYVDKGFPEGKHFGVIAQEIEKVIPDIVRTGPEGDKAVAYTELIPILIEAIKEQQAEIDELKELIQEIQKR